MMKPLISSCLTLTLVAAMPAFCVAQEGVSSTVKAVQDVTPTQAQAINDSVAHVKDVMESVKDVSETANLCRSNSGFMVPCASLEMVNQADIGYMAGMKDAMAGKPSGAVPAGGAPGSYARGYSEGLGIKNGNPTLGGQDAERAAAAQKTIEAMPAEKRPVFKPTFRGLIDYQNSVNAAQQAGYGSDSVSDVGGTAAAPSTSVKE